MKIESDVNAFAKQLENIIEKNDITIDRPKGTAHPRFPDLIYPIDYGYINSTKSQDGEGIDVFVGTEKFNGVVGIICTFDEQKKDSEIKVLYRCNKEEIAIAKKMLSHPPMYSILITLD